MCQSSLFQAFTVVKKYSVVWLRMTCGLGSSVQGNILLVSSGGCLKMGVVCLFTTVSIQDDLVSVWKYTILVLFRFKWYEVEGGWGLVWNSSFVSMISHTKFYRNKAFFHCWIKINQLDVTCFIISLFTAQHVSNVSPSIFRSLRLIVEFISCVVLLWYNVCWCYGVVRLGWWGILMQAETVLLCFILYHNPSSVYTALSDNMGGHLWASKLLITCTVIKVVPLHICFHVSYLPEIFHSQLSSIHIKFVCMACEFLLWNVALSWFVAIAEWTFGYVSKSKLNFGLWILNSCLDH